MPYRKLFAAIICCLIILQFISCQKDFNVTNVTVIDSTIITKNDSTLLKLFVKLDTLHTPSQDTLYKMEFDYDNLKRLVSYKYFDYDSTSGVLLDIYHTIIYYNGVATLPYKITIKESGYPEENIATFYENGNLSHFNYFRAQNPLDSSVTRIIYSGDNDIIINYFYPAGIYDNDTVYHQTINNNGNVLHDVRTYSESQFFSFKIEGVYTYENLFDNHINPFKKISFVFQLFDFLPYFLPYDPYEDGSFMYVMAKSKNNIIDSKFNRMINSVNDYNYYKKSYIYNDNGLPVSAAYTKQLAQNNQFYAGKELYFYTR